MKMACQLAGWMLIMLLVTPLAALAGKKVEVVTTLFPLYDFIRQVGGQHVDAHLLLPPGVEAHGFSPTPKDIIRIQNADVFVYASSVMEPWVEDLIKGLDAPGLRILEAAAALPREQQTVGAGYQETDHEEHAHDHRLEGRREDHHHHRHDHEGREDPHVWLDPVLAQVLVRHIAQTLSEADPDHEKDYLENAETYCRDLQALHETIGDTISHCTLKTVIFGGHNAFRYFSRRYHLEFVPAYAGFSPNAKPSPKALAQIIDKTRQLGTKVIFHEALINPKVARVIAGETGATLLLLHTLQNLSKDEWRQHATYIGLMRQNLEHLKQGLGYAP